MKLMLILGTRPQIIKSAPVIRRILADETLELQFVHTGQHYDYLMSRVFFDELSLPDPVVNLGVGSGSHASQTAQIMTGSEDAIRELGPDVVLVPGDTNSTLGGALAAAKMHVPVAHLEAGARSFDMKMPEEVNRRLTDHCSSLLLTPTENCKANLLRESIAPESVRLVGDTLYDALLEHLLKAEGTGVLGGLGLHAQGYVLLTVHRPENVDDPAKLRSITRAIRRMGPLTVVFAVHPRTRKTLSSEGLLQGLGSLSHVRLVEPLGYHENLRVMRDAAVVVTDSGGMQKEAFWLGTPCVTLRRSTEWVETLALGANELIGAEKEDEVVRAVERLASDKDGKRRLQALRNPFGDGKASVRVVEALGTLRPR